MYRTPRAGSFASTAGRKSSPMMATSTYDLNDQWADTLRRRYGEHKSGHKAVAERAQCGLRTVKGWFAGESTPSCKHMIAMMAADDALLCDVLRMAGREEAAAVIEAKESVERAKRLLNGVKF